MAGTSLINALTEVANIILSESVPREILLLLYGANVTALTKNGGGMRPIATGNTLRRMAGKIAGTYVKQDMKTPCSSTNGLRDTRWGAEAIVHLEK
jgi:hypothetical protein